MRRSVQGAAGALILVLPTVLLLLLATAPAEAQLCGPSNPNCIVPTVNPCANDGRAASTAYVANCASGGGGGINLVQNTDGFLTVTNGSGPTVTVNATTIGNNTVLGNVSGGTAKPIALTQAQLTALCNLFTSTLSGCVAGSGGGTTNFLRADGSWAAPPGNITLEAASDIAYYSGPQTIAGVSITGLVLGAGASAPGAYGGTICSSLVLTLNGSGVATCGNYTAHAVLLGEGNNVALGTATIGTAGRLLIDQGAGLDPLFAACGGDCTSITAAGVITNGKLNGVTYPSAPSVNTVPVVTSAAGGGTVTYEAVPNAALANSSITLGTTAMALGGTFTTIAGNITWSGVPSLTGLSSGTCSNGLALNASNQEILVSCPGAATSIAVGTTNVTGGTNTFDLYNNNGVLGNRTAYAEPDTKGFLMANAAMVYGALQ